MKAKPKIRVAMLIDAWFPFVGGGQIHVQNLIKTLEKNHPVTVYLFHAPHHNIIIRALWCFWVIPQVLIVNLFNGPFAIIHAHAFVPGIPAKIISHILRIPVIYTVHGSHQMDLKSVSLKAVVERWLLTRIKYTSQISVTKSFANYPNTNKVINISNGVDIRAFDQIKVSKHKNFTFLYVGRDHPIKGLSILRRAFAIVKKIHPKIELITITGKITGKALITAYKHAHAFVLPSLAEGQPLVLLEAWAAKLPIIATKTMGVVEIARHKKNALLINPGDSNQLARAMINLYNMSPSLRGALGKAGHRLINSRYTWNHVATKTCTLYRQVLA